VLIEFSVKNFRSFKERATLSLVATAATDHELTHVSTAAGLRLLRSAVVFGANASGKSNFLAAFDVMRSIVLKSAKRQAGDKLEVMPYLFETSSRTEATEFEVVFLLDGVKYQYGFSATRDRIESEWLFAFPKSRAQRWISREFVDGIDLKLITDKVPGQRGVWVDATRDNALVLSTAAQLNSASLTRVFNWFRTQARIIAAGSGFPEFTAELCEDQAQKDVILKIIKAADFNLHDIGVSKEKLDFDRLPDDMPESIKLQIQESWKDRDIFEIQTLHKTRQGEIVPLALEDESQGTQKFIGLIGPWLDTLADGALVWVDELHESLHPLMLRALVSMFHDSTLNTNGAQLIFTTHDTSLLTQKLIRRDQVWFAEKDGDGSSRLFPLTNFSPRKGREDLEDSYLSGRYGALPFIEDIRAPIVRGKHGYR